MACDPNEILAASSAFAGLTADQHDAVQTELLCRIYEGGGGGGVDPTALHKADNLSDVASVPISRTNLGIGTGDSPTFTGLTLSGLTPGSVLFAGAAGAVAQDNANFFWDDTNNRLGIGMSVPTKTLDVTGDLGVSSTATFAGSIFNTNGVISSTVAAGATISSLSTNNFAVHGFQISGTGTGSRDWRFEQNRAGANRFSVTNATGGLTTPFVIDGTTDNVGISTTGPLTKLTVLDTVSTSPRGILSMQISSDTSGARVGFSKARGTVGTPTTVVTGDTLGRLMFRGYDGTNYLEMASIETVSVGTIAATRVPTYMAFSTATDAVPSVLTERMRISSAGLVSVLGSLTVGGSAAINTISKVLQGSATLNPGSVAAGANATSTITVTGAAVSDPVILGLPDSWGSSNMFFTAWVSAANTVSIKYHNVNAVSAIDLASELVKVFVIQQ